MNYARTFFLSFALLVSFTAFSFVPLQSALAVAATGIVPDCNTTRDANGAFVQPCNFSQVAKLINNVIHFLIFDMAMPIAAIVFMYAGFHLITGAGNPTKREHAKAIFWKVLLGLCLALASWLIIKWIMEGLGYVGDTFF